MISCFQRESERSEGKIGEESGMGSREGIFEIFSDVDSGNMASKCARVAARRSGIDERAAKSIRGCGARCISTVGREKKA